MNSESAIRKIIMITFEVVMFVFTQALRYSKVCEASTGKNLVLEFFLFKRRRVKRGKDEAFPFFNQACYYLI